MATLDPDAVARATFGTARKGFDQHEVRAYLGQVAAELRRLADEAAQPRPPTPVGELTDEELTARLGDEAALVLQAAREAASAVRQRTEERVERLLREAADQAGSTREGAELERARTVAAATDEAERLVAAARADAERLRRAAADEVETAHDRARDLVRAAQEQRDEELAGLAERHREAGARFEELTAGLDQLERGLVDVAGHADEAQAALRRARQAGAEGTAASTPALGNAAGPTAKNAPPEGPTGPGPRPAVDLSEPDPGSRPAPARTVEPGRSRLLDDDDLPVEIPEGGPLDPRPGQYRAGGGVEPVDTEPVGVADRPPRGTGGLFDVLRSTRADPPGEPAPDAGPRRRGVATRRRHRRRRAPRRPRPRS